MFKFLTEATPRLGTLAGIQIPPRQMYLMTR
jgi:hypothetical protein